MHISDFMPHILWSLHVYSIGDDSLFIVTENYSAA